MEIGEYEIYKNRIEERFEDACESLSKLNDCHTSMELLESSRKKMSLLFNDIDFISACACSLYDTEHHEVGKWFADTSKEALNALAEFCEIYNKIDKENTYHPSEKAFASMQKLISTYLPKVQVDEVIKKLTDSNITTSGFTEKHKFRMTKSTEKLISYISSAVMIISIFIIALAIPNPSQFQYTVFRIIISLAAGGIAAFFSGFLTVEWSNKIKAGNGFGAFVIVYFVAPAGMPMYE